VLRVSGFGQTGPNSSRPGFGTLAEAMSGFAYINGWPDKPPTLPPFGLADAVTGISGAFGVLAAVNHRRLTGEGQDVDIALYEPMLTILGSMLIDYDQLGIVQERSGNVAPFAAPRNAYLSRDGRWFALSASTQSTASRLFQIIGRHDMLEDERFSDNEHRLKNSEDIDKAISEWAAARTLDQALRELENADVPAGAIYSAEDVLTDAHIRERGSVIRIDDSDLGPVQVQAPMPRLTRSPGSIQSLGGEIGRDNLEIYCDLLGMSPDEVAELRSEAVI
jgi:crotonobetainyl-CoA:carnitine CoA-transferase CaiB-like acyl-CoA transferase